MLKELFHQECQNLSRRIEEAKRNATELGRVGGCAKFIVACGLVVEPKAPMTQKAIRILGEALAGMFLAASAGSKEVTLRLDEVSLTTRGPVDESYVNGAQWMFGFVANLIARQDKSLHALCAFPTALLKASTTSGPDFTYRLLDVLKTFWSKKSDMNKQLAGAHMAAEQSPKNAWVQQVGIPLLSVVESIHSGSTDLDKRVIDALTLHKKYWTSKAERKREPWGYFAFELCALTAAAHDRGITTTVESEYLPKALVTGSIFK